MTKVNKIENNFSYAFTIKRDGRGYLVNFLDVPEALTAGDTKKEAVKMAKEALLTALEGYIEQNKSVPLPITKAKKDQPVIEVPTVLQMQILIWNKMKARNISKSELARKANMKESMVRRLLRPRQNPTMKSLTDMASGLGSRLVINLENVA